MPNHLFIYLIVGFNAACQALLIWRLKMYRSAKWKFCASTVAVPCVVAVTMRGLVAVGIVHGKVVEQVGFERFVTVLASMLLIAGPWLATAVAVVFSRRNRAIPAH